MNTSYDIHSELEPSTIEYNLCYTYIESLLMLVKNLMPDYGNYVVIPDWNGSRSETFCSHLGNTLTDMVVTA